VPTGSDWIHEIKYDGYRMMVIREQDRVRLIGGARQRWPECANNLCGRCW